MRSPHSTRVVSPAAVLVRVAERRIQIGDHPPRRQRRHFVTHGLHLVTLSGRTACTSATIPYGWRPRPSRLDADRTTPARIVARDPDWTIDPLDRRVVDRV